ncbi:hypothetical protein AgCh_032194 [Apium graveolens]
MASGPVEEPKLENQHGFTAAEYLSSKPLETRKPTASSSQKDEVSKKKRKQPNLVVLSETKEEDFSIETDEALARFKEEYVLNLSNNAKVLTPQEETPQMVRAHIPQHTNFPATKPKGEMIDPKLKSSQNEDDAGIERLKMAMEGPCLDKEFDDFLEDLRVSLNFNHFSYKKAINNNINFHGVVGVGMCMVGIEQNPVVYELMYEMEFQSDKVNLEYLLRFVSTLMVGQVGKLYLSGVVVSMSFTNVFGFSFLVEEEMMMCKLHFGNFSTCSQASSILLDEKKKDVSAKCS